jgi:HSP20 family molecular chaperone IbpA
MSHDTKLTKNENPVAQEIQETPAIAPAVDIFESEAEYLVVADLPGASENDVKVDLDDGELTLQASRRLEHKGHALSWEFDPHDFRRTFRIPEAVDTAKITADLKQGVLTLHLPKSEEVRPRTISVKAG